MLASCFSSFSLHPCLLLLHIHLFLPLLLIRPTPTRSSQLSSSPFHNPHHRRRCTNIRSEQLVKMLMQNYSRSVAPSNPVAVKAEITIQDINELSVMSNSFTADIWFSAIWHDNRLAFSHHDPCRNNMSFDDTFEQYLWSPNMCLVNTRMSRVHSSPKPNVLLMILSNGTVWLNYRVRIVAPCQFHLSDFPMDTAQCSLVFESYSFNTATVTIDWLPNAVTLQFDEISATDYELTHTKTFKHIEYYKAGEWYRLTCEIGFRRRYGYYILQVYVNMYINVFLSWIAFCISLKALPARVILSVNTLMSLILQFGNIISSLPPVSYVKSIDYFMFACIAFIFASLLEMAFIAYKDKKMLRRSFRFNLGMGSIFDLACIAEGSGAAKNTAAKVSDRLHHQGEEQQQQQQEDGGGGGGDQSARSSIVAQPWLQHLQKQQQKCDECDMDIASSNSRGSSQGVQSVILMEELALQNDIPGVQDRIIRQILRKRRKTFLSRGHRIDQISFMLFPLAFSLFNAIYWTYYLSKRQGITF